MNYDASYAIVERDQDGNVRYLPPLAGPPIVSVGQAEPDFVYYMTTDAGFAWIFTNRQDAEDHATALRERNPGRQLEVIELTD